jgi:hypothetical protein
MEDTLSFALDVVDSLLTGVCMYVVVFHRSEFLFSISFSLLSFAYLVLNT